MNTELEPQEHIEYHPDAYPEFKHWPKISRLSKETCVITEKIDGTNGIIFIDPITKAVLAGSRNRWLKPGESDNYGFRQWVLDHQLELRQLGHGFHYGEWYGQGIQRGYGLTEKRFALFGKPADAPIPPCCSRVPEMYRGPWDALKVGLCLALLREGGSHAVPGFGKPEGIVVQLLDAGKRYKVLLENDDTHKWEQPCLTP